MKVIGIGLNKTGTKTLKSCFVEWGLKHQSYDLDAFNLFRNGELESLLTWMNDYDSFEDWPWPLFYQQIEERFPDAKFILTIRKSPEHWYRSLCKMAIRMGPFNDFERHIYGYAMPQGRKQHHLEFYQRHNQEVESYFKDRPEKLLKLCWEDGDDDSKLAEFLGQPRIQNPLSHLNASLPVYSGDNLWLAHINRVAFQSKWKLIRSASKIRRSFFPKTK